MKVKLGKKTSTEYVHTQYPTTNYMYKLQKKSCYKLWKGLYMYRGYPTEILPYTKTNNIIPTLNWR